MLRQSRFLSSQITPYFNIFGFHRSLKNFLSILLFAIFLFTPYISWDRGEYLPNQSILIDMNEGRLYFFGIDIWANEIYYLTIILIFSAISLFTITTLIGRIWCGYACFQTVYTDLFIRIEHMIQGNRNDRIKLANSVWNQEKFVKYAITYICWGIVAFATGWSFISYFEDVYTLWSFELSPIQAFFCFLISILTFIMAGFMREKVCINICPYGRFQSAMIDENTLTVSYNEFIGEPRNKASESGCIDCGKCVMVCPMGIDIRNGLQMECISCGLCIDACDSVMNKLNRPKNLIRYNSLKNQNDEKSSGFLKFTAKNMGYITVLSIVITVTLITLTLRNDVTMSVFKENTPRFVLLSSGSFRNDYRISLSNRSHDIQKYALYIEFKDQDQYIENVKYLYRGQEYKDFIPISVLPNEHIQETIRIIFSKAPSFNHSNNFNTTSLNSISTQFILAKLPVSSNKNTEIKLRLENILNFK